MGTFLFWITVTHFVPKLGFISSTIAGSSLLFLNYLGAQKNFGSYKYLVSAFTMLGMTFALVEILVYPNVHNYKASFLFFSFEESFGLSGEWTRNIPLAGYTFFHSATMSLLSVQFIYRYWAVFDTNKLRYFKGCSSLIWFLYCSFFGFQYALGTYFFLARDPISDEYLREEVFLRYNANITALPATSIVAYDPLTEAVRWWNLMGVLNICSIVNFQYGVMIYCDHYANNNPIYSNNYHHFLPLFNLDVSLPSGVMLCSFTLYPATDSIIVMYVVSEYSITARKIQKVFFKSVQEIKGSGRVYAATSTAHSS
uniref:Seven TM Receptor n=1 Tax=Caenorhabditis tropicalis TaxID=1561998 RepID=A0A1I7UIN3_9PELO